MSRAIKTNFLIFLVLKDKKFCFFPSRNPQGFSFVTFFSVSLFTFLGCFHFSPILGVFIFHLSQVFPFFSFLKCSFSVFPYSSFSGVFIFHLSWVFPIFTFLKGFALRDKCPNTEFSLDCIFFVFSQNTGKYRPEKTPYLFAFQVVSFFIFFGCICVVVPRVLRIRETFFYSQSFFFTLHSFPTFGTNCFYHGFPGRQQFFLERCRASHWLSKHRPDPSVYLNYTMFSKGNSR